MFESNKPKVKYYFPTSLTSILKAIMPYIAVIGLIIACLMLIPIASAIITYPSTNNTMIDNTYFNVTWNETVGATSYQIRIDNSTGFASPEINTTTVNLHYNTTGIALSTGVQYIQYRSNSSGTLSNWSTTVFIFLGAAELYAPPNNTNYTMPYPEIMRDVGFNWNMPAGYASNLVISSDPYFYTIVYDETLLDTEDGVPHEYTHTTSLPVGNYSWKVRIYNTDSETYYSFGNANYFRVLNIPPTLTSTSIYGLVYKIVNNDHVPISGAQVRLWDNISQVSYTKTTGSNGYYVFENLKNSSTYFIQAKKPSEYDDSAIDIVTVGLGSQIENHILLVDCTIAFNCQQNYVYEKFKVKSVLDRPYSGVYIQIFDGDAVLADDSKYTDSMGQAIFHVIKDKYYRVVFSGGGLSNSITAHFYGKEDVYVLTVAEGFPTGGNRYVDVNGSFRVTTVNATHSNLSLIYRDNTSTTTSLNFYVTNYTTGQVLCSHTSTSYAITLNCTMAATGTYLMRYNATTTQYGYQHADDVINFNAAVTSSPQFIGTKVPANILNWLGILIMFFIAGLFSYRNLKAGVVIIPLSGVLLYWAGVLAVSAVLIHSALVLGVLINLRMNEHKVLS